MNPVRTVVLLALAAVVVAFVATWLTIPPGRYETHNLTTGQWTNRLTYPAKLFRAGLRDRHETFAEVTGGRLTGGHAVLLEVDLDALEQRVIVFYGGLAAVILLVGAAFGAFQRRPAAA